VENFKELIDEMVSSITSTAQSSQAHNIPGIVSGRDRSVKVLKDLIIVVKKMVEEYVPQRKKEDILAIANKLTTHTQQFVQQINALVQNPTEDKYVSLINDHPPEILYSIQYLISSLMVAMNEGLESDNTNTSSSSSVRSNVEEEEEEENVGNQPGKERYAKGTPQKSSELEHKIQILKIEKEISKAETRYDKIKKR